MNKDRRQRLEDLSWQLEEAFSTFVSTLEPLRAKLDDIRGEEADYIDNMPEGLQESEKGQAAQEALDNLDEALSSIDNATMSSDIDEAVSFIDKAKDS